ncbi:MAG: hypothetical protein JWP78_3707 [Mucilaginibacter sp.]|nr:hypothetical protein [Mucilaginibacter sp.]
MGVISEVTGTYNPLINLSLNFRESNKNINYVGGAMRIDSRSASPLFVWLSRSAGSSIENVLMSITLNGNVGIGTTDNANWQLAASPYKLAVGGSVIATAVTVKIAANWPDYVLKKDYQLPTLQDIKTYIDQHQHLPEMPSEQEIKTDGLNLGEMNKLLTKKVEELTLYLIEKDKQVKEDEAKVNSQEMRINKLEKELELILKMKAAANN